MSTIKSGIYKITNLHNGKIYIGSAYNLSNRISVHKMRLKDRTHKNPHLQNAWNKYGEDKFIFDVVEIVENKDLILEREQFYLDSFKAYNRDIGYNIARIAGNAAGVRPSKETRKKQSISAKRRPKRVISASHRENLSKALSGKGYKLNWKDVRMIRKEYVTGNQKQSFLAEKYKVSASTISEIIRNLIWKDKNYCYNRRRNYKGVTNDS